MDMSEIFRISHAGEGIFSLWRPVVEISTLIALFLFCSVSTAGEVLELSVAEADKEYTVRVVAVLDAPADYIYDVITDFRHAERINPAITSVDITLSDDNDTLRVQHHSEHRVGLFSFDVDWAGDVVEAGDGRIQITTVPELSSFDSGSGVWEVYRQGDRTYVVHESSLKPKFCIPPLIGTYVMKKHMKKETLATFDRIERHAQIMSARDVPADRNRLNVFLPEEKNRFQRHTHADNIAAVEE